MGGISGRFMSSFGFTPLLQSGFPLVSFTLTPMLSARLIKRSKKAEHSPNQKGENNDSDSRVSTGRSIRFYTRMLEWSMGHRWVIVVACLLVVVSIVPLFMFVGKNFLPVDDQSQFEINVRAPEGFTLAATSALAERVSADVRRLPGVTDTLTTIGGGQQEWSTSHHLRQVAAE